jgi:hypothetical protein
MANRTSAPRLGVGMKRALAHLVFQDLKIEWTRIVSGDGGAEHGSEAGGRQHREPPSHQLAARNEAMHLLLNLGPHLSLCKDANTIPYRKPGRQTVS